MDGKPDGRLDGCEVGRLVVGPLVGCPEGRMIGCRDGLLSNTKEKEENMRSKNEVNQERGLKTTTTTTTTIKSRGFVTPSYLVGCRDG